MSENDTKIRQSLTGYKINSRVSERIDSERIAVVIWRRKGRPKSRQHQAYISLAITIVVRQAWQRKGIRTLRIRKYFPHEERSPSYLAMANKYIADRQWSRKGRKGSQNGKKAEKDGKNQGKGKNSGANVRFAEIENGDPRNAVLSADQTVAVSEETYRIHRSGSINIENRHGPNGSAGGILRGGDQITNVLVPSIQVLTAVRCAVLTGCTCTKNI